MKILHNFFVICAQCRQGMVNLQIDYTHHAIILHCYNCKTTEGAIVEDEKPARNKKEFLQDAKRLADAKKKKQRVD